MKASRLAVWLLLVLALLGLAYRAGAATSRQSERVPVSRYVERSNGPGPDQLYVRCGQSWRSVVERYQVLELVYGIELADGTSRLAYRCTSRRQAVAP